MTTHNYKLHGIAVALVSSFTLLSSIATQAQEFDDTEDLLGVYGDEDTISIATGTQQTLAKAPAVASVITSRDIERMGANDIDEVLEQVPGLHITRSAFSYNPIYTFRGVRSNYNPQVLTLINGIRDTTLFHGGRHLIHGGMPVSAIARIEVIRGPGSAVYGADAFAGVINIITKTRQDIDGTQVGARAGSYDSFDGYLLHGSDLGEVELAFMAEYQKSDGLRAEIDSDFQTGLDAAFGTSASLAPGDTSLPKESWELRFDASLNDFRLRSGLQRRRNIGSGAGLGEALDPTSRYNSDRFNIDLSYHNPNFSENWDVQATLSYRETTQENASDLIIYPAGVDFGFGPYPEGFIGNPEQFERHSRFDSSAFYSGIDRHTLRLGAGYHHGDLYKVKEEKNFGPDPATGLPLPPDSGLVDVTDTPYVFLEEGYRENYYFFIQDIWQLADDWELTAGVRVDDYSDFGSTTNPRLALVWSTSHKLTSKLLYGQAFRAPAFSETRSINNPIAQGNPDLDPETMESLELAFNYAASNSLNLEFNLFHYHWDDIIDYFQDPSGLSNTSQNGGKQAGRGFEAELNWQLAENLQFNTNYSFVDAIDKDTDETVSGIPGQQLYAALNWLIIDDLSLNTEANWVMDRERDPQDQRSSIDDYILVNMALEYRRSKWRINASARNIFDTDAREPSNWSNPAPAITNDLPLASRHYRLEASYHF